MQVSALGVSARFIKELDNKTLKERLQQLGSTFAEHRRVYEYGNLSNGLVPAGFDTVRKGTRTRIDMPLCGGSVHDMPPASQEVLLPTQMTCLCVFACLTSCLPSFAQCCMATPTRNCGPQSVVAAASVDAILAILAVQPGAFAAA